MINLILVGIAVLLFSILFMAHRVTRRAQEKLRNRSAAAQLRRAASHMYKIARTAKMYALHDAIVLVLMQETARVLKLAVKLDPEHLATRDALRECDEILASFDGAMHEFNMGKEVEYPESELLLLEAQMHLTETSRLLNGLEKRGLIVHELRQAIAVTLQYAQRALELRLSLRQVSRASRIEHTTVVDTQRVQDYAQSNLSF